MLVVEPRDQTTLHLSLHSTPQQLHLYIKLATAGVKPPFIHPSIAPRNNSIYTLNY